MVRCGSVFGTDLVHLCLLGDTGHDLACCCAGLVGFGYVGRSALTPPERSDELINVWVSSVKHT